MKKWLAGLIISLTLSIGVAGAEVGQMTIIYSGNTDGELEPCGCSEEGNLGGILRRATTIDNLREENPNLFLVSSGGLLASVSPQDRLTGEYILKGLAQVGYDAFGLQWQDLAYGEAFIKQEGINWVTTNRVGDELAKEKLIQHGDQTLAFYSWLNPDKDPAIAMNVDLNGSDATLDASALSELLKQSQQRGALTMLATSLTLGEAQATMPLAFVDILLISSAYEVYGEPQMVGNTLVIQPGSRGMRLGHLEIKRGADGRITSYEHEVIKMPKTVADAERLLAWYSEYNAKVKEHYLERVAMRKAAESGESPYAGEEACASCHADEHDIWWDTSHSGAYETLEEVNKAFDPNCIACHTVGYEKTGGFIDMDATSHLLGVQCENCHGAAREHVESQGSKPVANQHWEPERMCAQCHVQKHSPSFKFELYWPRIEHGFAK